MFSSCSTWAQRVALPPAAAVLMVKTCSAAKIVGPASFRPSARQVRAAKGLRADDGADHVAVDVDVAVREPLRDAIDGQIDARMDAERQRGAVAGDLVEEPVEFFGPPAYDVQHRAENLLLLI